MYINKNIAYQGVVGLSTSTSTKAGQGNAVWEIDSQKLAKALGTAPAHTLSSPTNRLNYTTVTLMEVGPMWAP